MRRDKGSIQEPGVSWQEKGRSFLPRICTDKHRFGGLGMRQEEGEGAGAMRRRRGKRGEILDFWLTGVRAFARVNTRCRMPRGATRPEPDTSGQVSRDSRRVGTCGFGFRLTAYEGEGQMRNNAAGNRELSPLCLSPLCPMRNNAAGNRELSPLCPPFARIQKGPGKRCQSWK